LKTELFNPQADSASISEIGGKGYNLYQLQKTERVPEWIAVPASMFYQCLEQDGGSTTIEKIADGITKDNIADSADRIQSLILSINIPAPIISALEGATVSLFGNDYVSVRSSAADEDGGEYSFAGIHESYLYLRGTITIADHIRKVWASGYQERALLYRLENKLKLHPVPMAVIVQRMIESQSSGVVFTADPTDGNPHKMIISSLYGLGEGLVSAGLAADHIEFNKRTGEFKNNIADKESRVVFDQANDNGVCEEPVEQDMRKKLSLSQKQLDTIAAAALKIEQRQLCPQDIEFCFDAGGTLYILQTRKITTAQEYGPAAGNRQIWDNSNIIESYSGVTSPMTFSFIRNAYAVVYNCFSEVMGIPQKVIRANQNVYSNMLGLFKGQVYYNLPNWYRLVQQFPGYEYNRKFMESMMGVKDKIDSKEDNTKQANIVKRYFIELPRLLGLVLHMLYRFACLKKLVPAFNRNFNHYYDRWYALDFEKLPPHELMQIYHDMENHILRNWKTPIINDFYVMIFYGALKGCAKKWCGDQSGTLQNNLICGEGDIESTVPTRMLMKLAAEIKTKPELENLFLNHPPQELLKLIPQHKDAGFIIKTVDTYLEKYGFRCINELKLEEPSLHETPDFIYQMIANYVRMKPELLDISAMDRREQKIRADAEKQAFANLSTIKAYIFRKILKHARTGVKNRENMRFARTKIYGLLRQLLNAVGEYLSKEKIIDSQQDIYYLTITEVWDYIKGTAVTTDLRGLIAVRKTEFDNYREDTCMPDDHFETYGPAYHRNLFTNYKTAANDNNEEGTLHGIGCSPGSVTGTAKIIHSPKDDVSLNGEILVAARTDPGWVPLYPSVSGILIERGSILSHSAIVAREMGIPAIVGIPNLLNSITNGQEIQMDASAGSVHLNPKKTTP